jgi:hypothetical protein
MMLDEQELEMQRTDKMPTMLIAGIIFAIAALNLIFLFSELAMNVVRVYLG